MRTSRTSRPLDYKITVRIWLFIGRFIAFADGVKTTIHKSHMDWNIILKQYGIDRPANHDFRGFLAQHYFSKQKQLSLGIFLIYLHREVLCKNDSIWAEKHPCAILCPNYLWQPSDGHSNTKIRVSGKHIFKKCRLIPLFLGPLVRVLRYKRVILDHADLVNPFLPCAGKKSATFGTTDGSQFERSSQ